MNCLGLTRTLIGSPAERVSLPITRSCLLNRRNRAECSSIAESSPSRRARRSSLSRRSAMILKASQASSPVRWYLRRITSLPKWPSSLSLYGSPEILSSLATAPATLPSSSVACMKHDTSNDWIGCLTIFRLRFDRLRTKTYCWQFNRHSHAASSLFMLPNVGTPEFHMESTARQPFGTPENDPLLWPF